MGEITLDFLQGLLKDDYPDVTIQNFEVSTQFKFKVLVTFLYISDIKLLSIVCLSPGF